MNSPGKQELHRNLVEVIILPLNKEILQTRLQNHNWSHFCIFLHVDNENSRTWNLIEVSKEKRHSNQSFFIGGVFPSQHFICYFSFEHIMILHFPKRLFNNKTHFFKCVLFDLLHFFKWPIPTQLYYFLNGLKSSLFST